MLNEKTILRDVRKLHDNAKNGTLKYKNHKYTFIFNRYQGVYEITDESGDNIANLNTRKITVARTWLKNYMDN